MIHDQDRSGYFGGSDSKYVMAKNRSTATWKKWWETKLGHIEGNMFDTIYTRAGTRWEHPILYSIHPDMAVDGQIIMEKYKLRVNYDGWHDGTIYEIKTHKSSKEFDITSYYWQQCQVEMFVYQSMSEQWFLPKFRELYLVSYALTPDEYYAEEDEISVDKNRLVFHKVKYDKSFIKGEYLPGIRELSKALKKGKYPG